MSFVLVLCCSVIVQHMSHVVYGSNLCLRLCATWKMVVLPALRDSIFHIIVSDLGLLARVTTSLMRLLEVNIKSRARISGALTQSEGSRPDCYVYFVTYSIHVRFCDLPTARDLQGVLHVPEFQ